jgi:HPt (histidine-containing phosphotransfer) domain-containing protein
MNDFIAKPFAVDQMMAQIQRWTGCRPEPLATGGALATDSGGPPHESHPQEPNEPAALTVPGIDLTEGLKQWQAMGTYRTYLTKFVADYANAGLDIATAARNGDRAAAAALAHKLIGVAGNLAFPRVAELARQLEARLREGEPIIEMATTLQAAIDEVCTGITDWISTAAPVSAPQSAPTDAHREGLDTLFGQLIQALDHNDPDRAETVLAELPGLVAAVPLAEIQSHLTDFDFRGAEAVTRTLMRDLNIVVKE